jgi:hypothetical protein
MEERRAKSQIEDTIRSAVSGLPEKFRLCVELCYVEDLSYYAALNESSSFQTKQEVTQPNVAEEHHSHRH